MFKKILAFFAAMSLMAAFAAVDVNKATDAELDSLKGIGPVTSRLIIAERKKGEFKSWEDFISRVKGVGDKNAAKFSAEGMTVNGTAFTGHGSSDAKKSKTESKVNAKAHEKTDKTAVEADKPVTEKIKGAAIATKDAVSSAAVRTKDAVKDAVQPDKAGSSTTAERTSANKAHAKAESKKEARAEEAKADSTKPAASAAKK